MRDSESRTVDIRRRAGAQGVILFDASLLPQATLELADPAAWPEARILSGRGGRGGAVQVRAEFGEGILRHCRRGGLISRWNRDAYLFLGEARVRSVREFHLLVELRRRGLPVPRPVFAAWRRSGLFYRADLLTGLIAESRSLPECLAESRAGVPWEKLGTTIARFHRQGVWHADLNAWNILLDAHADVWLIDFDRGRLRPPAVSWQQANLARLRRSLEKLGMFDARDWERLRRAYGATPGKEEG